ncbi:hypothetical protein K7432_009468 [Basidiobolus ranarum]|uniref:Uncharacterized protein n=1 Tax=Basidiobolus ranarum TaxID=34480 RepID=A0ABR2VXF7_9FUNG
MRILINVLAFVALFTLNGEAVLSGRKPAGIAYKESFADSDDRSPVVDGKYTTVFKNYPAASILITSKCGTNKKLQGSITALSSTATNLDQLQQHGYSNGTAAGFYLKKGNRAILEDIVGYADSTAVYMSATNGDSYWCKPGGFGEELASVTLKKL